MPLRIDELCSLFDAAALGAEHVSDYDVRLPETLDVDDVPQEVSFRMV